jgi:uncharacterized membrane protein (UPF0127 family)
MFLFGTVALYTFILEFFSLFVSIANIEETKIREMQKSAKPNLEATCRWLQGESRKTLKDFPP